MEFKLIAGFLNYKLQGKGQGRGGEGRGGRGGKGRGGEGGERRGGEGREGRGGRGGEGREGGLQSGCCHHELWSV